MEAGDVEEIADLEPSVNEFSQSPFIPVELTGGPRNKTQFFNVFQADEVMTNKLAVSGMKSVNRNIIDIAFVEGNEFTVANSQVKAVLTSPTIEKSGRKDVYKLSSTVNVKEQ